MLAVILFVAILFIAFGIGAFLLRFLGLFRADSHPKGKGLRPTSSAREFAFGAALGLGAIAYLVFLLGLLHLLYAWLLGIILVVLAAIIRKDISRFWHTLVAGISRGLRTTYPYSVLPLAVFLLLIVLPVLLTTLGPSGGTDWDGLVYHLAVPKIYLQNHAIQPLPWMSHSNFPFVIEMLYALGLGLQGQALAKLFHFGCLILICVAVYCWAKPSFPEGTALLSVVILVSSPLVFWEATVAYNDLAFALFALLSIWAWYLRDSTPESRSWIILSGIFAGLALGVKYLAGVLVIFMIVAILWPRRTKETEAEESDEETPRPGKLPALGLWLLPMFLVALPWYLKSFLWTGNPVYPFFYEIFDGRYWSAALAEEYRIAQAQFGMGDSLGALLKLPWNVTIWGRRFYDQPEPAKTFNIFVAVIGPLFLAFLPTGIYYCRKSVAARYALGFSLAATLAWFFLSAQTHRYLMPVFPVLALVCAAGVLEAAAKNAVFRISAAAAVAIQCVLALGVAALLTMPAVPTIMGLVPRDEYLSGTLNIYPITQKINNQLPAGAKIMMFGDTRGFYIDREYMWGVGHHNLIPPEERDTPEELLEAMERLGVTHILLAPEVRRNVEAQAGGINAVLHNSIENGRLSPVLEDEVNGFIVYKLSEGAAAPTAE